jgi:hypothetical protein
MDAKVWYCVRLDAADIQAGRHIAIQHQFETVFRAFRGRHNDVGMYSSGFRSDFLMLYFSPATNQHAAPFLQEINAKACPQPENIEGFLVGHTGTMRQLLGPES